MTSFISDHKDDIMAICKANHVDQLYLFGSAATGEVSEESDLDFAVLLSDTLTPFEHGDCFLNLKENLESLFNREVDLVSYRVVKNPVFKAELDRTKLALYAA